MGRENSIGPGGVTEKIGSPTGENEELELDLEADEARSVPRKPDRPPRIRPDEPRR